MRPMGLTDMVFLLNERRTQPMHVGGLQLYRPPTDDPDFVNGLYESVIDEGVKNRMFIKRPVRVPQTGFQWGWAEDGDLDVEYHVRHSALPQPGRVRELLALTSRLHGTLLDRNRPLWEAHLIEGLNDGRFAVYTKLHHSLVDGVAAMRLLLDSMSTDPDQRDMPLPWAIKRGIKRPSPVSDAVTSPVSFLGQVAGAVGGTAGVLGALVRSVRDAMDDEAAALPFRAPKTIFNVPITGARRFAADSWELDRIKAAGKKADATINDMVLAMCSGALRSYLKELNALPEQPLVAMVPVSLRTADQAGEGGNAVGSILCNLATNEPDPAERIVKIKASMQVSKERLSHLSPTQIAALSALNMSGMVLDPLLRRTPVGPMFNLVISNVPGPRAPLYWNGARLEGSYPLSIPMDGQAMNITVTSNADKMEFGLVGCRARVPHLQNLLGGLEQSLLEIEKAVA